MQQVQVYNSIADRWDGPVQARLGGEATDDLKGKTIRVMRKENGIWARITSGLGYTGGE